MTARIRRRHILTSARCILMAGLGCAFLGQRAHSQQRTVSPATAVDRRGAEQNYLAGARLLDRKQLAEAQQRFDRAVQLDPARQEYQLALSLVRQQRVNALIHQAAQARLTRHEAQAEALLEQARTIDPTSDLLQEHVQEPQPAQPLVPHTGVQASPVETLAAPVELQPLPLAQDLHLRGDVRSVVTQAASAYGLRVVFDDSVTAQNLRFDLDATPYTQAMPVLLQMAQLFAVALDAKTLLVAKNTQENHERLERQVEETIYVPGSTIEQLNELSNIVKNIFDVKQVLASPGNGTLLLRAPQPTLKAVNYTLADLLDGGAEVLLDVKLMSVDKHLSRDLGLNPPTQVNAFSAAAELQSFVSANQSTINTAIAQGALVPTGSGIQLLVQEAAFLILSGLATDVKLTNVLTFFGNGLTLFGVSLGSGGTLNLGLNASEARALDDLSVRVGDRQTTTLRVGEKYPITTATYSSGISGTAAAALAGRSINGVSASSLLSQYLGSASASTIPLIQFEDLGITLRTTPTVLRSGLVRMQIDLKIEALTGASNNGIPILGSRAFISDITVAEGATAVMLSELSSSESASVNGFPGLASLPGFQGTLSERLRETDRSELVLLITPHLVRRRSAQMSSRPFLFKTSVPQDF